jgi:Arc-like DNA binding domain
MARKPSETVNLRVRLPESLRRTLANEAEKANRSLNAEILWRLGQTLSEDWQRFIVGLEVREREEEELRERIMQNPEMQETLKRLIADLRAGKFKGEKD